MTDKHFKLREDLSLTFLGRKLFRIEATKDLKKHNVKAGDIGGYIEKENNLSGNAWIYDNAVVCDNAKVWGDAEVYGNAEVCDNAEVYGDAEVCDNAKVYGDAEVYDDAWVCGDAWVYGNAEVCGNAKVYDNAKVYGNAGVCGNAGVYGDAKVCGDAEVYGNAKVCGDTISKSDDLYNITSNSQYNITILPHSIKIGCQFHKKEDWWNFTDREIIEMDGKDALKWWRVWKPILQAICEVQNDR